MRGTGNALKTSALLIAGAAWFAFLHCPPATGQPAEALKPGEGFRCILSYASLNSGRTISYQEGNDAVTRRGELTIALAVHGPEGAMLWAARNVREDAAPDIFSTAIDGDGNDLRDPEKSPQLWPNWSYSGHRVRPSGDAPAANYQLRLKVPPTGSHILSRLEGRICATRAMEETSVEVKPLKDRLNTDIEVGDYVVSFTSVAPQEVVYTVAPKDKGMMHFLTNCRPVAVTLLDGNGQEIRSGGSGTGSDAEKLTCRMRSFRTDVPEDAGAVISCVVKTADVEIPYALENIRLPGATADMEALRVEDLPVAEGYAFALANAYLNVSRSINYTPSSSRSSSQDSLQVNMNLFGPEQPNIFPWRSDRNGQRPVVVTAAVNSDGNSLLRPSRQPSVNGPEYPGRSQRRQPGEAFGNLQIYLDASSKESAVLKELEGYALATQVLEEDSFVVKPLNENLDKEFDRGDFSVRFSLKEPKKDRLVCVFTPVEKDGETVDLRRMLVAVDWIGPDGRELQLSSRGRANFVRGGIEWEARLDEPFPADGSAVITHAKKTADVKIPFAFKDVKLPTLAADPDELATPTTLTTELPIAEGYELRLRQTDYSSNRQINYQDGNDHLNEHLHISMSLYGPESPGLARARVPGLEQPLPSAITAAVDDSGKDLREYATAGSLSSRVSYPFGRWLPPKGEPIGDFNISFQNPPEEGAIIRKLEGYAVAVQAVEEAAVEIKPLKDNLNKDFEAGDAVIRFTHVSPEEVGYVISAKPGETGRTRRVDVNALLVGVRWFDGEGKELQVTSDMYPGTDAEGRRRRTFGFREPFPEDGYAAIVYITKTADVKIPFSFENVKLP